MPGSLLSACSSSAAPSLNLAGAYFPDWLIFATIAVIGAIVTRIAFALAGQADALPFPLFTCLAVGVLEAGLVDILWLGH